MGTSPIRFSVQAMMPDPQVRVILHGRNRVKWFQLMKAAIDESAAAMDDVWVAAQIADVGEASSADEAVALALAQQPDVVLMDVPMPAASRVQQGATLYALHCAACHGANLEGAPNWKQPHADGAYPPPPHNSTGHTWHHADALPRSIVEDGGDPAFHSTMPAFKGRLSPEEIRSIIEYLKTHWGREEREFQWRITATST